MTIKTCAAPLLVLLPLMPACAQAVSPEKQLIDLVINRRGSIVYATPLSSTDFTWADTADVFDRRAGSTLTRQAISRETLSELVRNSHQVSAAPWTTTELDSVLLVTTRGASLSFTPYFKSLSAGNEQLTKYYKKAVRRYNAADSSARDIALFARPVFDASKTYALVKFDNGYLLSGRGYLKLYKREKGWREIAILKRWVH